MKDSVANYIIDVGQKFSRENTSEYGYRTPFETLIKEIFSSIQVQGVDHDAKTKDGNKPDFAVIKNKIPILYIETKDIGVSLDRVEKSEQMARYYGYANLVLTDYLEFRFYRNGKQYEEPIKIAEYDLKSRTISPLLENYEHLSKTLIDFAQSHKEPIRSGEHLAKIMGGKAQRVRDNLKEILVLQEGTESELLSVYETIKQLLVHDLTPDSFADMYAQTLVYGLFVARFHDTSLGSFSRQEARDLIPESNPFLGDFFDHIAGRNFEKRLSYIVDELCEIFMHADVAELMAKHFKISSKKGIRRSQDQVIHFYEDFLKEYDDELRKKMGAYYTPLPVVQFIVRSVDELLQKEFGLVNGLADTSKTSDGLHRVQVLDPAVGTGTFISDVVGKIYTRIKSSGQEGSWPSYVHHDLLPRIYGFELMMAPYTIAHLKLSMALKETGFKYFNETRTGKARLGIYLTNSLEGIREQQELLEVGFGASIAAEAREASKIKNERPIMVVIGNPPYSGVSSNETPYANSLVKRYKVEPGGKQRLQEKKHWLNNDYVKFIAMAESMIEKTGEGVMAMITDNGYLDNPTFRGMRWHLAKTFDKIYIYDLHGSTKKHEVSPDGTKDENVFDIMQGVGIILAIKTGKKTQDQYATIYHADLFGTRKYKFEELDKSPQWTKVNLDAKMLYFLPKDIGGDKEYNQGFSVSEIFLKNTTGIVTAIDRLSIFYSKMELEEMTQTIINSSDPYREFNIRDGRKYKKEERLKELKEASVNPPTTISYRPFDNRHMYYTKKSECWINSPRWGIMKNYLLGENLGLLTTKYLRDHSYEHAFVTRSISEAIYLSGTTATNAINFPLYIYHEDSTRTANLNTEVVRKIVNIVGEATPEDIFDYIYAILHSPSYREKYKEFLKIDFPRIPYPKDKKSFHKLVVLGKELRDLHLMESPKLNKLITTYPKDGSNVVEKVEYKEGNVYINEEQYFGKVPDVAWNFCIGGYQPAQKWLKDRKGRVLASEEIKHYQKIIVAQFETNKIMKKIDES